MGVSSSSYFSNRDILLLRKFANKTTLRHRASWEKNSFCKGYLLFLRPMFRKSVSSNEFLVNQIKVVSIDKRYTFLGQKSYFRNKEISPYALLPELGLLDYFTVYWKTYKYILFPKELDLFFPRELGLVIADFIFGKEISFKKKPFCVLTTGVYYK